MDVEAKIIKSGQIPIQATLRRNLSLLNKDCQGLSLTINALPIVEDFMRSLGNGELIDIRTLGRHWMPIPATERLSCYHLQQALGILQTPNGVPYQLDRPNGPLSEYDNDSPIGNGRLVLNLGFLRLAGISEAQGVTFAVKGVQTLEGMRQIGDQYIDAFKHFFITYLKPIDISVQVHMQEMHLPFVASESKRG